MMADLAVLGGKPAFAAPVPVGQFNTPERERCEAAFRDLFARRYYTNQGPLAQQLEARLQALIGVQHAICVTNATIGLMIAAKALELRGRVICPALTSAATAQSISWAGLQPVFCDVEPNHQLSPSGVERHVDPDVSAILGVHLWGNSSSAKALGEVASARGISVYYDAAHAFGSSSMDNRTESNGCVEVFSFFLQCS